MKKLLIYLLFLANFGVLMYSWWQFSGSLFHSGDFATTVLALGRLAGIIATYLILLQFILIGRVKWVETVFGLDLYPAVL